MSEIGHSAQKRSSLAILLVATVVLCTAVPLLVRHPILDYDAVCRYAPMAEAFADGNWNEAFHPRFGVLFPFLSGSTSWITGLDGFKSCVLVATVAWVACIIPVFKIAEWTFDCRTAWMAVVLYLICPLTLQHAFKGLREPIRTLGILLMTEGVFGEWLSSKKVIDGLVPALIGIALLCLIKVDTVALALVLLLPFAFVNRGRLHTWLVVACMTVLLQIPCFLVWKWTGCWSPSLQVKNILERII